MGYSRTQILLHWLIAALVLVQYLTVEAMEEAFEGVEDGVSEFPLFDTGSRMHLAVGLAILCIILIRLALRVRYAAPPAPVGLIAPLAVLAKTTHWGFYVVLTLLPLSGLAAIVISEEVAGAHKLLFNLLLALLALHVAGVLFHTFVLGDGVAKRMLVAGRRPSTGAR